MQEATAFSEERLPATQTLVALLCWMIYMSGCCHRFVSLRYSGSSFIKMSLLSLSHCKTSFNVTPVCIISPPFQANLTQYNVVGGLNKGEFEGGPDIAGIGVSSCLLNTLLMTVLMLPGPPRPTRCRGSRCTGWLLVPVHQHLPPHPPSAHSV